MTQNVVQSIAPFVQQNFIIKELPSLGADVVRTPDGGNGRSLFFLLRNGGPPLCRGLKIVNFRVFEVQFHKHRNDPWYIQIGEFPMPCCTPQTKSMGSPSVFGWWFRPSSLFTGVLGQEVNSLENSSCLERCQELPNLIEIFCFFGYLHTGLLKAPWF